MQNNAVFLLGNATILFFPLLHADSILGMPDLFGLSFLLVVSLVLFEYDIRTINWNNNWILIFSTLAAIISRRWYVFGIIGAYTGFAIASILYNIKDAKKVIINGVYTSVFLGIVIFIVLCPFFIHSLNSHYSIAYSAWKYGGALWEIRHQGMFLGVLISGLIVLGGIIGLSRKETRFSSTVAIIGFFITIITFTRIQNFMSHHALCLMPTYLSLIFNVILHIASIQRNAFRRIIGSVFLLIFLVNFSCSISGKVIRDGRIHWINSITLYVNNADTHANAWE